MKTYAKFAALVVLIVGTLIWLAMGGINESSTYYKTISEVSKMGHQELNKRLRVTGNVVPGSIKRVGTEVHFVIQEQAPDSGQPAGPTLQVIYTGTEPLPDTLKDKAQAMADGKLGPDGVFRASSIAAKCPSKYQAKPGGRAELMPTGTNPSVS
jgi:cytochrome c-type biogenesis protein CcmE